MSEKKDARCTRFRSAPTFRAAFNRFVILAIMAVQKSAANRKSGQQ